MSGADDATDAAAGGAPPGGPSKRDALIETYKLLESRLSDAALPVAERAEGVRGVWGCIRSLCALSAHDTHGHLLEWAHRHTYTLLLQSDWQKAKCAPLRDALDAALAPLADAAGGGWEAALARQAGALRRLSKDPWAPPVLRALLDPSAEQPSNEMVLEWLTEERGSSLVTRLQQLSASKCDDIALSLITAIMGRIHADRSSEGAGEGTLGGRLRTEAGFSQDVTEQLMDIELMLLFKLDKRDRFIELVKEAPLQAGKGVVERLCKRADAPPPAACKRLYRNIDEVATLAAQVMVARCLVVPRLADDAHKVLLCCSCGLSRRLARDPARLRTTFSSLANLATTALHLHTLAYAVKRDCGADAGGFVCELYVRALTAGMNELERLKLSVESAAEARQTAKSLAMWLMQLAELLVANPKVHRECVLTAFSVHPAPVLYERVANCPRVQEEVAQESEPSEASTSEFGSWATDSRPTSKSFVKDSSTLEMSGSGDTATAVSPAVLEGEGLGLAPEMCHDLAALLSGPRIKTLHWQMDRERLLENCRKHMERTAGGTRAVTTAIRFPNLDMSGLEHLPYTDAPEDETDLFYGIQKGYEHLVEFEEEPQESVLDDSWHAIADLQLSDSTASASDDSDYRTHTKQKKIREPVPNEDSDPLSFERDEKSSRRRDGDRKSKHRSEGKRSKKRSKERSKDRSKDTLKEKSSNKPKRRERKEKQSHSKETNKDLMPLSQLVGLQVQRVDLMAGKLEQNSKRPSVKKEATTDSDYDSQGRHTTTSDDDTQTAARTCPRQTVLTKIKSEQEFSAARGMLELNRQNPVRRSPADFLPVRPKPQPLMEPLNRSFHDSFANAIRKSTETNKSILDRAIDENVLQAACKPEIANKNIQIASKPEVVKDNGQSKIQRIFNPILPKEKFKEPEQSIVNSKVAQPSKADVKSHLISLLQFRKQAIQNVKPETSSNYSKSAVTSNTSPELQMKLNIQNNLYSDQNNKRNVQNALSTQSKSVTPDVRLPAKVSAVLNHQPEQKEIFSPKVPQICNKPELKVASYNPSLLGQTIMTSSLSTTDKNQTHNNRPLEGLVIQYISKSDSTISRLQKKAPKPENKHSMLNSAKTGIKIPPKPQNSRKKILEPNQPGSYVSLQPEPRSLLLKNVPMSPALANVQTVANPSPVVQKVDLPVISTAQSPNRLFDFFNDLRTTNNAGAVKSPIKTTKLEPKTLQGYQNIQIQNASENKITKGQNLKACENALNTFARRNYMHKTKQNEVRKTNSSHVKSQAPVDTVSGTSLQNLILQSQGALSVFSKTHVHPRHQPAFPKSCIIKYQPAKAPLQKQSSIVSSNPLLTKILATDPGPSISTTTNSRTNSVVIIPGSSIVSEADSNQPLNLSPQKSHLTESDQHDIVNLLLQQNKLLRNGNTGQIKPGICRTIVQPSRNLTQVINHQLASSSSQVLTRHIGIGLIQTTAPSHVLNVVKQPDFTDLLELNRASITDAMYPNMSAVVQDPDAVNTFQQNVPTVQTSPTTTPKQVPQAHPLLRCYGIKSDKLQKSISNQPKEKTPWESVLDELLSHQTVHKTDDLSETHSYANDVTSSSNVNELPNLGLRKQTAKTTTNINKSMNLDHEKNLNNEKKLLPNRASDQRSVLNLLQEKNITPVENKDSLDCPYLDAEMDKDLIKEIDELTSDEETRSAEIPSTLTAVESIQKSDPYQVGKVNTSPKVESVSNVPTNLLFGEKYLQNMKQFKNAFPEGLDSYVARSNESLQKEMHNEETLPSMIREPAELKKVGTLKNNQLSNSNVANTNSSMISTTATEKINLPLSVKKNSSQLVGTKIFGMPGVLPNKEPKNQNILKLETRKEDKIKILSNELINLPKNICTRVIANTNCMSAKHQKIQSTHKQYLSKPHIPEALKIASASVRSTTMPAKSITSDFSLQSKILSLSQINISKIVKSQNPPNNNEISKESSTTMDRLNKEISEKISSKTLTVQKTQHPISSEVTIQIGDQAGFTNVNLSQDNPLNSNKESKENILGESQVKPLSLNKESKENGTPTPVEDSRLGVICDINILTANVKANVDSFKEMFESSTLNVNKNERDVSTLTLSRMQLKRIRILSKTRELNRSQTIIALPYESINKETSDFVKIDSQLAASLPVASTRLRSSAGWSCSKNAVILESNKSETTKVNEEMTNLIDQQDHTKEDSEGLQKKKVKNENRKLKNGNRSHKKNSNANKLRKLRKIRTLVIPSQFVNSAVTVKPVGTGSGTDKLEIKERKERPKVQVSSEKVPRKKRFIVKGDLNPLETTYSTRWQKRKNTAEKRQTTEMSTYKTEKKVIPGTLEDVTETIINKKCGSEHRDFEIFDFEDAIEHTSIPKPNILNPDPSIIICPQTAENLKKYCKPKIIETITNDICKECDTGTITIEKITTEEPSKSSISLSPTKIEIEVDDQNNLIGTSSLTTNEEELISPLKIESDSDKKIKQESSAVIVLDDGVRLLKPPENCHETVAVTKDIASIKYKPLTIDLDLRLSDEDEPPLPPLITLKPDESESKAQSPFDSSKAFQPDPKILKSCVTNETENANKIKETKADKKPPVPVQFPNTLDTKYDAKKKITECVTDGRENNQKVTETELHKNAFIPIRILNTLEPQSKPKIIESEKLLRPSVTNKTVNTNKVKASQADQKRPDTKRLETEKKLKVIEAGNKSPITVQIPNAIEIKSRKVNETQILNKKLAPLDISTITQNIKETKLYSKKTEPLISLEAPCIADKIHDFIETHDQKIPTLASHVTHCEKHENATQIFTSDNKILETSAPSKATKPETKVSLQTLSVSAAAAKKIVTENYAKGKPNSAGLEYKAPTMDVALNVIDKKRKITNRTSNNEVKKSHTATEFVDITMLDEDVDLKKPEIIKENKKLNFKATIMSNNNSADLQSLLSGKEFETLMGKLKKDKKYTVTLKPMDGNHLNIVTEVKEIDATSCGYIKPRNIINIPNDKKPNVIDFIDLLSDDDEDEEFEPMMVSGKKVSKIQSEFGNYYVPPMNKYELKKHQTVFRKRCLVKLETINLPKCLERYNRQWNGYKEKITKKIDNDSDEDVVLVELKHVQKGEKGANDNLLQKRLKQGIFKVPEIPEKVTLGEHTTKTNTCLLGVTFDIAQQSNKYDELSATLRTSENVISIDSPISQHAAACCTKVEPKHNELAQVADISAQEINEINESTNRNKTLKLVDLLEADISEDSAAKSGKLNSSKLNEKASASNMPFVVSSDIAEETKYAVAETQQLESKIEKVICAHKARNEEESVDALVSLSKIDNESSSDIDMQQDIKMDIDHTVLKEDFKTTFLDDAIVLDAHMKPAPEVDVNKFDYAVISNRKIIEKVQIKTPTSESNVKTYTEKADAEVNYQKSPTRCGVQYSITDVEILDIIERMVSFVEKSQDPKETLPIEENMLNVNFKDVLVNTDKTNTIVIPTEISTDVVKEKYTHMPHDTIDDSSERIHVDQRGITQINLQIAVNDAPLSHRRLTEPLSQNSARNTLVEKFQKTLEESLLITDKLVTANQISLESSSSTSETVNIEEKICRSDEVVVEVVKMMLDKLENSDLLMEPESSKRTLSNSLKYTETQAATASVSESDHQEDYEFNTTSVCTDKENAKLQMQNVHTDQNLSHNQNKITFNLNENIPEQTSSQVKSALCKENTIDNSSVTSDVLTPGVPENVMQSSLKLTYAEDSKNTNIVDAINVIHDLKAKDIEDHASGAQKEVLNVIRKQDATTNRWDGYDKLQVKHTSNFKDITSVKSEDLNEPYSSLTIDDISDNIDKNTANGMSCVSDTSVSMCTTERTCIDSVQDTIINDKSDTFADSFLKSPGSIAEVMIDSVPSLVEYDICTDDEQNYKESSKEDRSNEIDSTTKSLTKQISKSCTDIHNSTLCVKVNLRVVDTNTAIVSSQDSIEEAFDKIQGTEYLEHLAPAIPNDHNNLNIFPLHSTPVAIRTSENIAYNKLSNYCTFGFNSSNGIDEKITSMKSSCSDSLENELNNTEKEDRSLNKSKPLNAIEGIETSNKKYLEMAQETLPEDAVKDLVLHVQPEKILDLPEEIEVTEQLNSLVTPTRNALGIADSPVLVTTRSDNIEEEIRNDPSTRTNQDRKKEIISLTELPDQNKGITLVESAHETTVLETTETTKIEGYIQTFASSDLEPIQTSELDRDTEIDAETITKHLRTVCCTSKKMNMIKTVSENSGNKKFAPDEMKLQSIEIKPKELLSRDNNDTHNIKNEHFKPCRPSKEIEIGKGKSCEFTEQNMSSECKESSFKLLTITNETIPELAAVNIYRANAEEFDRFCVSYYDSDGAPSEKRPRLSKSLDESIEVKIANDSNSSSSSSTPPVKQFQIVAKTEDNYENSEICACENVFPIKEEMLGDNIKAADTNDTTFVTPESVDGEFTNSSLSVNVIMKEEESLIKSNPDIDPEEVSYDEKPTPEVHNVDLSAIIIPKKTYSGLKRKVEMKDVKIKTKKYREGKCINFPKQTKEGIDATSYKYEIKTLQDYRRSLRFTDKQMFLRSDPEEMDVETLGPLSNVPIYDAQYNQDLDPDAVDLFEDLGRLESSIIIDPNSQSLNEEMSDIKSIDVSSPDNKKSDMGFGEGSDRVIVHLKKAILSKVSAATLSDVKPQPLLQSENCENNQNTQNGVPADKELSYENIKDSVRCYFENYFKKHKCFNFHHSRTKICENAKVCKIFKSIPGLYTTDFLIPPRLEQVVHVVQVGQLPVSAAAQNPVSCDPCVSQASDASPSRCSDSSPQSAGNENTSIPKSNEYTELTTADVSRPVVIREVSTLNEDHTMDSQGGDYQELQTVTPEMFEKSERFEPAEPIQDQHETEQNHIEENLQSNNETHSQQMESPVNNQYNNLSESPYINNNPGVLTSDTPVQFVFTTSQPNCTGPYQLSKQENGSREKNDQIANAMTAAGIATTTSRAQALVNILSQKIIHPPTNNQSVNNSYQQTTSINAMAIQQALAQILPPPLNQTNSSDNPPPTSSVGPQVLHIVQGKNAAGNQITLLDNSQQSVISSQGTQVLHIVQNKNTNSMTANGPHVPTSSYGGISLVDAGLQQGGNQLLHIVNAGTNQNKNTNAAQLLKRVNLLTSLANVQGSNEQKMVQFVCKSADGKSIQLNAPHQRSMVLRLQPIETPTSNAPVSKADVPSPNVTVSSALSKDVPTQQEIKSRSIYEENYAKFIQSSGEKPLLTERANSNINSLPKFNQAFGKTVYQDNSTIKQDDSQNSSQLNINSNGDNTDHSQENATSTVNLDHMGQISSPPLLIRKTPTQASQSQQNLVQQIKQTMAPMNIQTMHGGVIYTRQIPVNIGGGQTINLITVPSTELIDDSTHKPDVKYESEQQQIIKIIPQSQLNLEAGSDESDQATVASESQSPQTQAQPVLTQMRIKLPMLSKTPQVVPGARVVRPFFQIQRNVITGTNQPVYQQLVLTTAPPLGQQTIRLPQPQQVRQVKIPSQPAESNLSTSTLEQLREFDMVLEQVKERSTVQTSPGSTAGPFSNLQGQSESQETMVTVTTIPSDHSQQVLYSIGASQALNVAYVNRKTVSTPTTTFVRSPDSTGIADSPTSTQMSHSVSDSSTDGQNKPKVHSKNSKSRPHKPSSTSPSSVKVAPVAAKTSSAQKPLEDEQTTQRILYILAEYKEQVENSPDKDKPAPRRRSNPPTNPTGSSKRKKSSGGSSRRPGRDLSPVGSVDDLSRTLGSEDSSCGTSQGDCTESCALETQSPQGSPRKATRKLTFEQEVASAPIQQRPQRNVIVADGQTIAVTRSTGGKPATAVLMPANYLLPVSMMKGGQQIAIVTNRGPKILTMPQGEGGAANAVLLQRLIGPAGLKPVLARPGVRHVRLPTAALHNLQAFNLTAATSVPTPQSNVSSPATTSAPTDHADTPDASPWPEDGHSESKAEESCSGSEAGEGNWRMTASGDTTDYTYEEPSSATPRDESTERTVLGPIHDRYSPDMDAHRIFDKMFDVESKKSCDSPRATRGYDMEGSQSDCEEKQYHQAVVHKKESTASHGGALRSVTHVSATALRHKYAILENELRLQKSLSEECEDLGVDSPSASELFPEAELLFAASPAHEHSQEHAQPHATHAHPPQPQPTATVPRPDLDDQTASDRLLPAAPAAAPADGLQRAITLDQEEFARAHPNTTFHSEPTEVVQPFTIAALKARHITSTIFHPHGAPTTVLMAAPAHTVISHAPEETAQPPADINYSVDIHNMISVAPGQGETVSSLPSVLVKDDGLTRFDSILTDSRELHLSNSAASIVHANTTQVIRRVGYDNTEKSDPRDSQFSMDESDAIAGEDAKMSVVEDSSREATLESIGGDADDDRSSPERQVELFWESNSASERSEGRRRLDFSSDSDKCCKSPSLDETNSTDSSVGRVRLDSVIKEARRRERCGSGASSAEDNHPPVRTYPPKRALTEAERSVSGKTRAGGERSSPESPNVRRRASNRGVVKRGCHCCNGSPEPSRPKKPRKKPTADFSPHD